MAEKGYPKFILKIKDQKAKFDKRDSSAAPQDDRGGRMEDTLKSRGTLPTCIPEVLRDKLRQAGLRSRIYWIKNY